VNILRRLPLSRLLLACAVAIALGVCATALAFAIGSGPTPPPKALPQAVHDALAAPPVEGVTASVELTDHLLEGAGLASASGSGGASGLAQSPLLTGASGRLWIAKDGRARLELQSEGGDTQVLYDGHAVTVYDAKSNTLYRYTPPAHEGASGGAGSEAGGQDGSHAPPSIAQIEEAIAKLSKHADVSGATPTDVAGQPAYTVRVAPKESGSLIGGAELSWDANTGVPLRAAVYSSGSSAPVIELAASEISYGPVASSVFEITTPASAKVEELKPPSGHGEGDTSSSGEAGQQPQLTTHGHGITGVEVLEAKAKPGQKPLSLPESLPKVKVGESTAAELQTALGTVLGFERSGVRYLVFGAVSPAQIEAVARGL
jgi:outer membrane lipoprotein-sorting protein